MNDDTLTDDPHSQVSLIYYANKQGLEDRVFRIETDRSSATTPDTRTGHSISNLEILAQDEERCELTFNWVTHSFRYDIVDVGSLWAPTGEVDGEGLPVMAEVPGYHIIGRFRGPDPLPDALAMFTVEPWGQVLG